MHQLLYTSSANAKQLDIIDHRTTQRPRVIARRGVERAQEHDTCARRQGGEQKLGPLEPSFAFGLVRHLHGLLARKRFDNEGPFAAVVAVSDGECEGVAPARLGEHHLGQGALFSGDELDGSIAFGDGVVLGVDVFYGFEGFDDPAW